MRRSRLLAAAAALCLLPLTPPAEAGDTPLSVVASFSILGDMVRRIGGDHVAVTTLVGPDGDTHVYQPTPADAQAVAAADLVVVNGLHFEGWIDRLIEASGYDGAVIVATAAVDPITFGDADEHAHQGRHAHDHDHGDPDPHAWHDLRNGALYAEAIAAGLGAADPAHADTYAEAAAAYRAEMLALDAEIRARFAALPESRRRVLSSHDAFAYFGRAYGVAFEAPVGVSTDSEASAQDVARMIDQIVEHGVSAIFIENIADRRLVDQIAADTGAVVGGVLYSDALSPPDGPAATYLDLLRGNAETIASAIEAADIAAAE